MEQNQEMKPPIADFMQQPFWATDDKIVVTGKDFEVLYNFVSSFGPAVDAARKAMQDNISNEVIKMRYVREDGTEVPQAEVDKYKADFDAYVAKIRAGIQPVSKNAEPSKHDNSSNEVIVRQMPGTQPIEEDVPQMPEPQQFPEESPVKQEILDGPSPNISPTIAESPTE